MSVEYFLSKEAAEKWADENTDDLGRPIIKKLNFTDENTQVLFKVIKATRGAKGPIGPHGRQVKSKIAARKKERRLLERRVMKHEKRIAFLEHTAGIKDLKESEEKPS